MRSTKIVMVLMGMGLFLFACNPGNTENQEGDTPEATNASLKIVVEKDEEGRVVERYSIDTVRDIRQGPYSLYYPDSSLMEEGTYVDGKIDGIQKIYYPSGQLEIEAPLKAGRFEGVYKRYHENGQLAQEVLFKNNKQEGQLKSYYSNGQVREVVAFEGGQEKGAFVEYHRNGEPAYKGTYLYGEGSEDGLLEEYDTTGTLIRKAQCDSGRCETTWRLEDQPN